MKLGLNQSARLEQRLLQSPQMIQAMQILQLNGLDLEERIEQELESNPLLELAEPGPPEFRLEFAGSLLQFAVIDQATRSDRILLLETRFAVDGIGHNWSLLIVPASEFDAETPGARFSYFRHKGDMGASSDWAGLVYPPLGEPLAGS